MEHNLRPDDLVKVTLTLRSRAEVQEFVLNEAFTVEQLGMQVGQVRAREVEAPVFDTKRYMELLKTDPEGASRFLADFNDAVGDAIAEGDTPAQRLADAVVDHLVRTQPRGKVITRDANSATGYILNPDEINIQGPFVAGDTRTWKATAVGTWGEIK